MGDAGSVEMIRRLYAYHRWANRRLFEAAAALGEDAAGRDVGTQFSFPTVRRMFAHLYGADSVWLMRWKGTSPPRLPGAEIASLAELRERWDALEKEQQAFVESLTLADLDRVVDYKNTEGKAFHLPQGPLLQHVANHATHHRSEIAAMLTMIHGSPPPTDLLVYHLIQLGQLS